MSRELATTNGYNSSVMEDVILNGNLSSLQPKQRIEYYNSVCESLSLNPLTRPMEYINLNGRLTLYVKRDATEQLRKIHGVSITIADRSHVGSIYIVTARATDKTGRYDESTGAVNVGNLKGDNLANALMKAETKAKRRVTLSIVGLGWLDESEVDSIQGARQPSVDMETGEIVEAEPVAGIEETASETPPVKRAITAAQLKRFHTIANSHNWSKDEVDTLISHPKYGFQSSKDISVDMYEQLCLSLASVEAHDAIMELMGKIEAVDKPDEGERSDVIASDVGYPIEETVGGGIGRAIEAKEIDIERLVGISNENLWR